MSGVNKVILVGRLGADPELKQFDGGNSVARLSLATSETWVDKEGQKQERTEWHKISAWGKQAEVIKKYATKGSQLYIEGKIQTRSWEENGQKKYSTEIICSNFEFLGSNGKGQDSNGDSQGASNSSGGVIPF